MAVMDWNGTLRKRAEACLRAASPAEEPPPLRELRVHRVELEMQNEALREAHAELEASRERYRRLYELAPVGYVTLDPAGVVLQANALAVSLLDAERLVGSRLSHHLGAREGRHFDRYLRDLFGAKGAAVCELPAGPPGPAQRQLRFDGVVVPDEHGRRVLSHTAIADVTAQRRLESEPLRAHRMEMLGRLVAGIAHDFGNVLTVVAGAAAVGRRAGAEGDPAHTACGQIAHAAEHGVRLVQRLLAFARAERLPGEPTDVNAALEDTAPLLCHLLGDGIALRLDLEPGLAPIGADGGELAQALMNLVANARDAMPSGGTVVLQSTRWPVQGAEARRLGVAPGPYVAVVVSDRGRGMDAQTRARLFEPFHTTKPPGRGTGLGLATVRDFVLRAGGTIDIDSQVGVGTVVTLLLPPIAN